MFQSAIISRVPLLMGTADVLLLTVIAWSIRDQVKTAWQWSVIAGFFASIGSALPFGVIISSYIIITGITIFVRKRVWKVPLLGMFLMTFLGTLIIQVTSLVVRLLSGINISIIDAINLLMLPSLLLNILLAIPVFIVISEIISWLYRNEIKA